MCGIVGILMRPHSGPALDASELVEGLVATSRSVESTATRAERIDAPGLAAALVRAAADLSDRNRQLRARPAVRALVRDAGLRTSVVEALRPCTESVPKLEAVLDAGGAARFGDAGLEAVNRALVSLADAEWAVRRDRLRTASEVAVLAPTEATDAGLDVLIGIQQALSSLDRLEIRGRDSAGLYVLLTRHGLDTRDPAVQAAIVERAGDPTFGHRAAHVAGGRLGLVWKCAQEIGELGDNVRFLRAALADDPLLAAALQGPDVRATILGHTRWASVGRVNEANAHPLNEAETPSEADARAAGTGEAGAAGQDQGGNGHAGQSGASAPPAVVAAINGDIDNHADLRVLEGLGIDGRITTDAKVMPVLMSRRLTRGDGPLDAFRDTIAEFDGSLAVGAICTGDQENPDADGHDPHRLYLAIRGSGQGQYVGLADHAFVVASEPYGLVEETSTWLRMDGEATAGSEDSAAARGEVVVLDASRAADLSGISRFAMDGTPLPVGEEEIEQAEITTRDIDRGPFPHFLLKEISEAPQSVRKTLRGKLYENATGRLRATLGPQSIPDAVARDLGRGAIARVVVTGQGTAAVAGQGIAAAIKGRLRERNLRALRVEAMPATELSGFHLVPDMADTLVVAISQSGTTTDTLTTVNLAQRRGASVIAIVNRRNSDLAGRANGVIYTSDGRDVEMSVASTKAFYSQIAAGVLLASAIADLAAGSADRRQAADRLLAKLRALPDAMERTLALQGRIAELARRHAPRLRDWSVVGNGLDRVAAEEIRIKLSELCYKAIACDATEDKKHIDLSSEPLILVCATGVEGSTAADTRKEIAVFRAHRATPIVIASEGVDLEAPDMVQVPATAPELSFVLATIVGHLFGYHAALAIDELARPMRAIRAAVDSLARCELSRQGATAGASCARLRELAGDEMDRVRQGLADGSHDGVLRAGRAVRLAGALDRLGRGQADDQGPSITEQRTVASWTRGAAPETGRPGPLEELQQALDPAIDDLTRHVDTIKHQAKTVTVGISRHDQTLGRMSLGTVLREAGAPEAAISREDLHTLNALDPFVEHVLGYVRYRLWRGGDGPSPGDAATIRVLRAGGLCRDLQSRTVRAPLLKGTKYAVAVEGRLLAARGRTDGRVFIGVPEFDDGEVSALDLIHVRFRERAPADELRCLLGAYRNRYADLRDLVLEVAPAFDDALLAELGVEDLLIDPLPQLAERWRVARPTQDAAAAAGPPFDGLRQAAGATSASMREVS